MCNCNVEKYLIKELIEQDNRLKNNVFYIIKNVQRRYSIKRFIKRERL